MNRWYELLGHSKARPIELYSDPPGAVPLMFVDGTNPGRNETALTPVPFRRRANSLLNRILHSFDWLLTNNKKTTLRTVCSTKETQTHL